MQNENVGSEFTPFWYSKSSQVLSVEIICYFVSELITAINLAVHDIIVVAKAVQDLNWELRKNQDRVVPKSEEKIGV